MTFEVSFGFHCHQPTSNVSK